MRHAAALPAASLSEFDDLLHSIHPDAPHLGADRLADATLWLLGLSPAQARRERQQRVARLRALRRMADDTDWDTDPDQHERLQHLFEALAERDTVAYGSPPLGRLDEALLVELAWPAFAEELEDYRDFCRFRDEQHPLGALPLKRSEWVRMRAAQGPLWQRMARLHGASLAHLGPGERESRAP